MRIATLLLFPAFLLASGAVAQSVIDDLKLPVPSANPGSSPQVGVTVGGVAYFRATNAFGNELWRSDGTVVGTRMVKDIQPGPESSAVSDLTPVGNLLYFTAWVAGYGLELWVSDGTAAGTQLVIDPAWNAHDLSSGPRFLTEFQGRLYFAASNGGGTNESWRIYTTDGTAPGTQLVNPIVVVSWAPGVNWVTTNSAIYFVAVQTGLTGAELWKTDGTAMGTTIVKDLIPGSGNSNPQNLTTVGHRVFFTADHGTAGRELHVSDGTAAGTQLVADIRPGTSSSSIQEMVALNTSVLVFTADDGVHGREVWRSDGTAAGTFLLGDVLSGASGSGPSELTVAAGRVTWTADDGVNGTELWSTDGTVLGTQRIDLQPGPANSGAQNLTAALGGVVLSAPSPFGNEVWFTDGTPAGTRVLVDVLPGSTSSSPAMFTAMPNGILFEAIYAQGGRDLYYADGTQPGTIELDLWRPSGSSNPRRFLTVGNELFFAADGETVGNEPWSSDGTAAGTQVHDIVPGQTGSLSPSTVHAVTWNGEVWFQALDPVAGRELHRSDGTLAGTRLAIDVHPSGHGSPEQMTPAGSWLFFVAANATTNGKELFATDGTQVGTVAIDLRPGLSSNPRSLTALGDRVFFVANDGIHGDELWISDGTVAGTTLLEIAPGAGSAGPVELTVLGNRVFFRADVPGAGWELCVSDGTPGGTGLFVDLNPGPGDSLPQKLTRAGTELFFTADDLVAPQTGRELWATDGTIAGTRRIEDLTPGNASTQFEDMVGTNGGRLFFIGCTGSSQAWVTGLEVWTSDGTAAGTVPVVDLLPGDGDGAQVGSLRVVPGAEACVFAGSDGVDGLQLWISDAVGTTRRLGRIGTQPGAGAASITELHAVGTDLFFACDEGILGNEPWVVSLIGNQRPFVSPYGRGCQGSNGVPAIGARGLPSLGSTAFAIDVTNARQGSLAQLQLAIAPLNIPIGGGCHLLVLPPLTALAPVAIDGRGLASTAIPIPSDPVLLGSNVNAQYVVLDPNGSWEGVAAFSDGLLIIVGL